MIKKVKYSDLRKKLAHSALLPWVKSKYGIKIIDIRSIISKGADQCPGEVCDVLALYLPVKVSTVWGIACIKSILTVHSKVVNEALKRLSGWSKKALRATEEKLVKTSEDIYKEWELVASCSSGWEYQAVLDLLDIPFDSPDTVEYSLMHALNSASNSAGTGKSSRQLDYKKKNIAYREFSKLGLLAWDTAGARTRKNNKPANALDIEGDTL